MSNELVSVIIPVYNSEKYISRCVKSILSQKYECLEIILINDGSKDKSAEICNDFANADSRIKVIHQQNSGVSAARNAGLDIAQGRYIVFIDADDEAAEGFLELAVNLMQQHKLDLLMGGMQLVYSDKTEIKQIQLSNNENFKLFQQDIGLLISNLISDSQIPTIDEIQNCANSGPCAKMYTKAAIDNVRFPSKVFVGEDKLFNLEVLLNCKRVGVCKDILYKYFQNDNSATNRKQPKAIENFISAIEYEQKFIEKNKGAFKKELDFFNLWLLSYAVQMAVVTKSLNYSLKKQKSMLKDMLEQPQVEMFLKNVDKSVLNTRKKCVLYLAKRKMKITLILMTKILMCKNSNKNNNKG